MSNSVTHPRQWLDDDKGLTLIELLIAVVVLGIITGAITNAVIQGLKITNQATSLLSESHDTQLATAYFTADAENAEIVSRATNLECEPANASFVLRFEWTDPKDSALKIANYYSDLSGSERMLKRHYCEIRDNPDPTKDPVATTDQMTIAHNLAIKSTGLASSFLPDGESNPHVVCLADGSSSDCSAVSRPTRITLRLFSCVLEERTGSPDKGDCRRDVLPADGFAYKFEISATRRPA